jgi:hypothetical protein
VEIVSSQDVEMSTFEQVAEADAAFYNSNKAQEFDANAESSALVTCLESADVSSICMGVNQTRWQQCKTVWLTEVKTEDSAELGAHLKSIVEELDAPHLRPTSILSRIQGGVNPACHSLFALMDHLKSKKSNVQN